MEELLTRLNKEKMELFGKIRKIEKFRGTEEWKKLSTNHKQLLDIQLAAMHTYLEALIGRYLDLEENKEEPKGSTESEKQVKVMIIGLGE